MYKRREYSPQGVMVDVDKFHELRSLIGVRKSSSLRV